MREWLSKDFNPPADLAGRIAKTAVKRAKKRKAIERTAMFFIPFLLVASFVVARFSSEHPQAKQSVIARSSSEQLSQSVIARSSSEHLQAKQSSSNPLPLSGGDTEGVTSFNKEDSFQCTTPEGAVGMTAGGRSPEGAVGMTDTNIVIARSSSERFPKRSNPPYSTENPLRIQKLDHSLEISWEGDGEFIVYKCDSPKFDKCSFADVVSGNRYLDKDDNSAKIVYYRIEPLKKG